MTVIQQDDLAALLPHAEPMILLDTITQWDRQSIRCSAYRYSQHDNPLRIEGVLSVFSGVEYAAQAMAAHAKLCAPQAQGAAAKGFIATASKLNACAQRLDQWPGELIISARQLAKNPVSSLYEFCLSIDNATLLTGQITAIIERATP